MKPANWFFASLKKIRPLWILLGIVGLALVLRLVGNTVVPPSPYWEEVALGYDAYSILQTGADHQGNTWPLVAFPSFGDFKPSGYFYALVPSIALFGLNVFAVRLPAVLASAGTTVFVYLWARDLAAAKSRATTIGLVSALLWAVQPWSWWLGRIGFEVNLATFFLTGGTYLFWRGLKNLEKYLHTSPSKPRNRSFFFWMIPATLFLALSMYTYHGARALAPLFTFGIFLWHSWHMRHHLQTKKNLLRFLLHSLSIAAFAILLTAPILVASQSPVVQQRINETSLFSDLTPLETSNSFRAAAGNTLWARIVYHRYFFWMNELMQNYLRHLSPTFLFTHGDTNPRHSSQYLGLLYPWELLTIGWGIIAAWKASRKNVSLLLILTLLSPVAAMITLATPHALRAYPLSGWLAIFSGWGTVAAWHWIRRTIQSWLQNEKWDTAIAFTTGTVFGCIIFGSTFLLGYYLSTQYPERYSHEWQYGYEELVQTLRQHQQPGENLYVSRAYGRPAMYVLFYEKVDPRIVQAASPSVPKDQREFLTFQEWSFFDGQKHATGLHAAPNDMVPENSTVVDTIQGLDGETIWTLYR